MAPTYPSLHHNFTTPTTTIGNCNCKVRCCIVTICSCSGIPCLQQTMTISAAPLEHGRKYEGTALKAYGEKTGSNVTASGLVICLQKPYLACSPDGIVDDCMLIEIKCPYVARDKPVTPLTVPYLELGPNGKLRLKHDHDYMYQVQGNMNITRKTLRHLVIFTLVDLVIVDVPYNSTSVYGMLNRLDSFFRDHYRKEYLDKHVYLKL